MGTNAEIVPATERHADLLAPLLRPEDVAEGRALGLEPLPALRESLANSDAAYAFILDGEVAALFGTVPLAAAPAKVGIVWMLSGRAVTKHKRAFLRASRQVMPMLFTRYECLTNAIDARYTAALRWARWMGFELREPVPLGPLNLPFHPFTVRRP